MSFTLKSIELNNIRVHKHILFEPATAGITAISGENGTGKSTIVDSLAWVLYGTRVNNVKTKNLIREGVNPKVDKVFARVVLLIGGIEYKIERKITTENGASECNVWGRHADEDDFVQLAGPAVTHVESYIRQLLKMDEKGFLASVLIQQKQVDQIVSASPRERGEVIEKLTGISSITQSISLADEEARTLRKAAAIIPTGDLDEADEKVKNQETVVEDFKQKEIQLIEEFATLKDEYSIKKEEFTKEQKKVEESNSIKLKIDELKMENRVKKEQLQSDLELVASNRKKYGDASVYNFDTIKESRVIIQKEFSSANNEEMSAKRALESLESQQNAIEKLTKKALTEKEMQLTSCNEEIVKFTESLTMLEEQKVNSTAEIQQIKNAIAQINSDELTHCPLCMNELHDPEHLKKEHELTLKTLSETLSTIKKSIKEAKISLETLKNDKESLETAINEQIIYAQLQKEIKVAKDVLKTKKEVTHSKQAEFNVIEKQYEDILKIEADKSAIESAKQRSLATSERIKENTTKIKEMEARLEEIGALSKREYSKFENEVKRLNQTMSKVSLQGKEIQGKRKLAQERLNDYQKNYNEVKTALDKYNEIADKIKVYSATSTLLNEFKRTRIEYSIPTLEFYASDILNKFTSGAFIKLSLDERFNATVTTSAGTVRPINQLSGGELSAAAIALRLGISLLLSSNDRSVLIFDEVLVSMDEERARQIMETVSSLSNAQVIFIAHGTDINSVADKTVLIERS